MAQQPQQSDGIEQSTTTRGFLKWSNINDPTTDFKGLVAETLRQSAFIEVESVEGVLVVSEVDDPKGWLEDEDAEYEGVDE